MDENFEAELEEFLRKGENKVPEYVLDPNLQTELEEFL